MLRIRTRQSKIEGVFRLETYSNRASFTVEKQTFRRNIFRLSDPTGTSSRKGPSIYTGGVSVKLPSRRRVMKPSHRSSHHKNTHTHTSTLPAVPGTTPQHHTTALTLAWLISLLLLLAASQRGAFLAPLTSSVYHTMAVACGIDVILQTTATPAVASAALG